MESSGSKIRCSPCSGTSSLNSKRMKKDVCTKKFVMQWLREISPDERRAFTRQLVAELEDSELDELDNLVYDAKSDRLLEKENLRDIFSLLPPLVIRKILLNLDPVSLCRSQRVSQLWYRMSQDPLVWKSLCHHPHNYRLSSVEVERDHFVQHTTGGVVRWKEAFTERYRLWSNWHAGRCVVRTFHGHTQGISCVQFDNERIVSGSSDSTIRLWDLRRDHPLGQMTLNGHSATVRCLHLSGNTLASGSNDFSIKVWNLDMNHQWSSIACRKTMLGHTNFVRCLQMDEKTLMSGSYDHTLRLWSLENGECQRSFTGHNDAVLCVQYVPTSEIQCVSGSADNSIKVWDVRTGQCEMTIHNAHEDAVTCVRFDAQRIVSGSIDRMIKMWDVRTGKCFHTIDWRLTEGHTGVVRCLQADAWRLVSAADDRTIKVWNVETGDRLCTLQSHTDGVTCVQFDDKHIVSGSFDKTVKLWDFSLC